MFWAVLGSRLGDVRGGLEHEKGCTPGSMNSLFSDFFREFWRGILAGVRDYLGEILGGF